MTERKSALVGRHSRYEAWCARRALLVGGRRPHREVSPGYLGKLRTRVRQSGKHRTALERRRALTNAECLSLPSGFFARKRTRADPGKEGLGGIPRSAPFDASAST